MREHLPEIKKAMEEGTKEELIIALTPFFEKIAISNEESALVMKEAEKRREAFHEKAMAIGKKTLVLAEANGVLAKANEKGYLLLQEDFFRERRHKRMAIGAMVGMAAAQLIIWGLL